MLFGISIEGESTERYIMEKLLEPENPIDEITDASVEVAYSEVQPESYSLNKLITAALTILVLAGIIWPFYSIELKKMELEPPSIPTPEITETPVTMVAPVATVTSVATVTPVVMVTSVATGPEAQPTGKKIGIKLDRRKGFFGISQGTLMIKPGDGVVWFNEGIDRVTLVSSDGLFEPKILDNDKRTNYTFKKSGTYGFYLKENKNLNLTIAVEP